MNELDWVVVAGAGHGIGRAIALAMGKTKARILCISKSESCQQTAGEINAQGGYAESLILDLRQPAEAKQQLAAWVGRQSAERIGVVLSAAVLGPQGPMASCDLMEWDEAHRINVIGNLAILQALLPCMLQHRFGRILAFSGGGAAYAYPLFPAYSATKTAMVRTVENLHEELKTQGDFAVVCLAPGAIETALLQKIRAAGAEIKTVTDISEPVQFAQAFLSGAACNFSGRFVHVRDNWQQYMNSRQVPESEAHWKLRRME